MPSEPKAAGKETRASQQGGPCMFENLMSLLLTMDRTGLTIQTTQPDDVTPGPGVPKCVDHWELEIPEGNRTHTTANCAAPGAGLGNI
jgi:hypothetical protein